MPRQLFHTFLRVIPRLIDSFRLPAPWAVILSSGTMGKGMMHTRYYSHIPSTCRFFAVSAVASAAMSDHHPEARIFSTLQTIASANLGIPVEACIQFVYSVDYAFEENGIRLSHSGGRRIETNG